jgi:hypothetical protein
LRAGHAVPQANIGRSRKRAGEEQEQGDAQHAAPSI